MKLFLKGERCFKPSCAIEKRNFAPGQHGHDRKAKIVGYGSTAARKTESKAHLRRTGKPVPRLLSNALCARRVLPVKTCSPNSSAA